MGARHDITRIDTDSQVALEKTATIALRFNDKLIMLENAFTSIPRTIFLLLLPLSLRLHTLR